MRRITLTEEELQVVTETRELIYFKYEDYPILAETYEVILNVVKSHRTPDQIKADELTEFAIQADPDGALDIIADWEAWTEYRYGQHVVYDGVIYRVVQPHRSQHDWKPDQLPALYTPANKTTDPVDGYPEWVQPLGEHDAYSMGDKVSFMGKNYESVFDGANTWSPTAYPTAWQEIEVEE